MRWDGERSDGSALGFATRSPEEQPVASSSEVAYQATEGKLMTKLKAEATQLDVRLMDIPALHVAAVAGPMASAQDTHPIHKKFVQLMISDVPRALCFEGVESPSGGNVRTGALVYGDYTQSEAVMSAFKQCLFIGDDAALARASSLLPPFAELAAADSDVTVETTQPGLYAVVTHTGAYAELASVVRSIMYAKLPSLELIHSGGPIIEFYRGPSEDGIPVTDVAVPVSQLP